MKISPTITIFVIRNRVLSLTFIASSLIQLSLILFLIFYPTPMRRDLINLHKTTELEALTLRIFVCSLAIFFFSLHIILFKYARFNNKSIFDFPYLIWILIFDASLPIYFPIVLLSIAFLEGFD